MRVDFRLAFILALAISAGFLVFFYNQNQGFWWDEAVYLGLARNILSGEGYQINQGQEAFRPPLFPYLLAGVWAVTGVSEPFARALPLIFAVLSVFLAGLLGKRLYGKEAGFWTAAFVGTSYMFLFHSLRVFTEPLFLLLGTGALLALYMGGKDERLYTVCGLLMGLAFLTRYAGGLLVLVYLVYGYWQGRKVWKKPLYWAGLGVFVLVLVPWLLGNMASYGSPIGAVTEGLGTVAGEHYPGPVWFYLQNWIAIFGAVGILAIPGVWFLGKRRKEQDVLVLIVLLVSLVFFSLLARKELRYLVHFFQVYYLVAAMGLVWLCKRFRRRQALRGLGIVLVGVNLAAAWGGVQAGLQDGISLVQAGEWLEQNAPPGAAVMSNNWPHVSYLANRRVVPFPERAGDVEGLIGEQGISHLLINYWEPTYPGYLWDGDVPSDFLEQFELEGVYQEKGRDIVWVYSTG